MAHIHSPTTTSDARSYERPARGAHKTQRGENPAAHGGVTFVDRCECGAQREVNSNNGRIENGAWYRP